MRKDEFAILLRKNQNGRNLLRVKHNPCKTEFLIDESVFLKSQYCLKCEILNISHIEELRKRVSLILGKDYFLINRNLGKDRAGMILSIKHVTCGQVYKIKLRRFLKYHEKCPCVNASKGEQLIRDYLIRNSIRFYPQYIVRSAQHIFDFVVFKGNAIVAFIEFDGEQHFKPIAVFGGIQGFESRRKKDAEKNKYCRKKKVKLIRIPYYIDNIEKVLNKELEGLV